MWPGEVQFLDCLGGERGDDWFNERDVRVAGGTADIENGQLLVIKRCLCPIAFCNYKCLNVGIFPISGAFFHYFFMKKNE